MLVLKDASLTSVSLALHPNWAEFGAASTALQRFVSSLPSFPGFEPWRNHAPFLDVELFAIHTITNVCTINLRKSSLEMENFQAANYVMSLIRQLGQSDYEWLDPLMSVSAVHLSMPLDLRLTFLLGMLDNCCKTIYPGPLRWFHQCHSFGVRLRSGIRRSCKCNEDVECILSASRCVHILFYIICSDP